MSIQPFIPYGHQWLDDGDISAVSAALQSDWLTQGPLIAEFERALARRCGAKFAVAVANGTAALHLAALAAGFGPGDEVITSPITFVASANCLLYTGACPGFADIDPVTYCLDPASVRRRITPATRGLIPVHFAGQPCDMSELGKIAREHELLVIEDAAHAIGASYQLNGQNNLVGSCAHSAMTIFSFHPVKHITSGEGGAVTTNSSELYEKLLLLRNHGIARDPGRLERYDGPWYYEMQELGFNYRITDFQCALGLQQLERLTAFIERRLAISAAYDEAFRAMPELIIPVIRPGAFSSYHLYVLQLRTIDRAQAFDQLREQGLGVNVHYIPVHLQPYYARKFGYLPGDFPEAERYYARAISLPIFPRMNDDDVRRVIRAIQRTVAELSP
ncbi:MAG: UDP-4-amino-4,6-dideoxy-N-acetyl-beta-L-altrosamine transaminase [Cyanobacteria bacterium NC_groundwater_1444_Ag_S-0.65um_54_12]|nr:UDP-4-amino-4,6-dideoxy-N-acetyl-beta-L-altrosamine transaminase [Cyanobacteria bacterium NC_groundwater_1444_Ag_S-0.65um_54_12]